VREPWTAPAQGREFYNNELARYHACPGPRHRARLDPMRLLIAMLATLLLSTCSQPPSLLERILAAGELRVVTRNSPDAYYLGSHGPEGPAYELASRFAEALDVPLRLYTVRTREAAIEEVASGRAHLAAAGLSTGVDLPADTRFGPGYHRVREHLIYLRSGAKPQSVREAARGVIEVAAGSVHQRTLEDLRLQQPISPGFNAASPTRRSCLPMCRAAPFSTRSRARPNLR